MPQVRAQATIKRHGRLHDRGTVLDVSEDELRGNPKLYVSVEDEKPSEERASAEALQQSQAAELERLRNNRRAATAQLAEVEAARAAEAKRLLDEAASKSEAAHSVAAKAAAEAPSGPVLAEPPIHAPAKPEPQPEEAPKLPPHKRRG